MSKQGSIYKRSICCGVNVAKDAATCRKCGASVKSSRATSWSFRVDLPSPEGQRDQRSRHGFSTRAAAQAALDAMKAEVSTGTYVEPSKLTVGEWLATWLSSIRHDVSEGTWAAYEGMIRNYLTPRIGSLPIQKIDKATIKRMYVDLRDNGRIRGEGGLSAKSVHNCHLCLHRALEAAVEDRIINRNPADSAHKVSKDEVKEMSYWSVEEVRQFLDYLSGDEFYALFHLAIFTGARRGELCGARWRDINLDAGTWTVRGQIKKGRDGVPVMTSTKSGKSRMVTLDPESVDALRQHKVRQNRDRLLVGADYRDNDLVFALPDGSPLHPDGISQRFNRHVRDSGIRRIRFHDLRHTSATILLANGMPLNILSKRLGHASVAITGDLYAHVSTDMQHEALDRAMARWRSTS